MNKVKCTNNVKLVIADLAFFVLLYFHHFNNYFMEISVKEYKKGTKSARMPCTFLHGLFVQPGAWRLICCMF